MKLDIIEGMNASNRAVARLEKECGAKDKRIAELGLKSCTLDLTKGHLSQCEAALESRDKRIEELEKALSDSQTQGDKALAIRDLEQQAKGLIDYAKNTYDEKQTSMYVIIILEAEHLQLKAKALKESKQWLKQ